MFNQRHSLFEPWCKNKDECKVRWQIDMGFIHVDMIHDHVSVKFIWYGDSESECICKLTRNTDKISFLFYFIALL